MKIADHIKQSIDAADRNELAQALLSACLAVDGTSKKTYPDESSVGVRFRRFINDNLDVIELMFGGLDLRETISHSKIKAGELG